MIWMTFLLFRTSSERQLAGPEGPHAWGRRCVLRRRLQRWNWSRRVCPQRGHDLCRSKTGQHQIPFAWGMCTDLITCHGLWFFAVPGWVLKRNAVRFEQSPSLPFSPVFQPEAAMSSFQCQVLLCPPGRDCLHSCEIRRSPQPKLRKIALPQPWQQKPKPQSQRQPQSQQFPWSWQRITPLLTSSQPLSFPFLNHHRCFALLMYPLMFLPLLSFSGCQLLIFNFCICCPHVLVDDLGM